MSFSLMNAPTAFLDVINKVFQNYLDSFVIVVFCDVLVYSKKKGQYKNH